MVQNSPIHLVLNIALQAPCPPLPPKCPRCCGASFSLMLLNCFLAEICTSSSGAAARARWQSGAIREDTLRNNLCDVQINLEIARIISKLQFLVC